MKPWIKSTLILFAMVGATIALIVWHDKAHAAGMMGVGHMMGPTASGGSDSGNGLLTESGSFITTESGSILEVEHYE